MEVGLSLENILGAEDIENLFVENPDDETQDDSSPEENEEKETKENKTTTEVDADTLFDDKPESVSSGKDNIEEMEDAPSNKDSSSPNTFFSSMTRALMEEGIFPDLDDESISNVKSAEDFRDLIDQQIKAGIEEKQQRIDEALNAGMEPDEIKRFEATIDFLDKITDETLSDESEQGEKLRKDLIFQDFINRGYSKERAQREVQKSFNAGTDIDDAKEALNSNKEYFNEKYDEVINTAKEEARQEEEKRKQQAEDLKKSILTDKELFGGMVLDKQTRQRIYDNLAKPVYKNPKTGDYLTAIQKYEQEHKADFLKNLGLIFTLTDGFKNLDGLVKDKVKKEVKKGLRELENTLNNTARSSDGTLRFSSGVGGDTESFIGKGWNLDI